MAPGEYFAKVVTRAGNERKLTGAAGSGIRGRKSIRAWAAGV